MRHAARLAGAALVTTASVLSLAACGGGEKPTSSGPDSSSPSPSPTPTSASAEPTSSDTPTATPTAAPIEAKAPVKVARTWAAGLATDINNRDSGYAASGAVSTAKAKGYMNDFGGEDIGKGEYYPGPLPFTPVSVRTSGGKADVSACMWLGGWGQDRTTHNPVDARKIGGVDIVLQRVGGGWRFDDLQIVDALDCSSVRVDGVPF